MGVPYLADPTPFLGKTRKSFPAILKTDIWNYTCTNGYISCSTKRNKNAQLTKLFHLTWLPWQCVYVCVCRANMWPNWVGRARAIPLHPSSLTLILTQTQTGRCVHWQSVCCCMYSQGLLHLTLLRSQRTREQSSNHGTHFLSMAGKEKYIPFSGHFPGTALLALVHDGSSTEAVYPHLFPDSTAFMGKGWVSFSTENWNQPPHTKALKQ